MRKRLKRIRQLLGETQHRGYFDETVKESDFFFNPVVKEVYEREGPYQIPSNSDKLSKGYHKTPLINRPPFRLLTGIIYNG